MQRIIVIGVTGSGKTTLAHTLAERLSCPMTDIDDLYWRSNWTLAPEPEYHEAIKQAVSGERWILSGNYSRTHHLSWPRADTLIWINYPFWRVFFQLARRTLTRIIDKKPVCNGNIETWRQAFSKNSIFLWLFKSYPKKKREYSALFTDPSAWPHLKKIRLRSPDALESFLDTLVP